MLCKFLFCVVGTVISTKVIYFLLWFFCVPQKDSIPCTFVISKSRTIGVCILLMRDIGQPTTHNWPSVRWFKSQNVPTSTWPNVHILLVWHRVVKPQFTFISQNIFFFCCIGCSLWIAIIFYYFRIIYLTQVKLILTLCECLSFKEEDEGKEKEDQVLFAVACSSYETYI